MMKMNQLVRAATVAACALVSLPVYAEGPSGAAFHPKAQSDVAGITYAVGAVTNTDSGGAPFRSVVADLPISTISSQVSVRVRVVNNGGTQQCSLVARNVSNGVAFHTENTTFFIGVASYCINLSVPGATYFMSMDCALPAPNANGQSYLTGVQFGVTPC